MADPVTQSPPDQVWLTYTAGQYAGVSFIMALVRRTAHIPSAAIEHGLPPIR